MKLGILKADDIGLDKAEGFGEYPDMFKALLKTECPDLQIITYEIREGHYPKDIDEVDAYLLTGSRKGVYDNLDWFPKLTHFIRQLHNARKSLIGICFGHQFIAQALGGKVEKSPKGWGIGRHTVTLTSEAGYYAKDVKSFSLMTYHQDQVIVPAPNTKIVASSDFCPAAMCVIGDHILTFQAHPEFSTACSKKLLKKGQESFDEVQYTQALNSLAQPLDRQLIARWIKRFALHH
ncbi:MAG: GMP synthase [Alphaproteobacteria bacterium]|nr:GMP synthase [Alphaproteobacteria bacterium]